MDREGRRRGNDLTADSAIAVQTAGGGPSIGAKVPWYALLLDTSLLWAVVLTILTWPFSVGGLYPQTGFDASWQGTLAMATVHQFHFGTQTVFTYGPLGFLTVPALYYSWTAVLAFVYEFAISATVFYLFVRMFRRQLPLPWSVVLGYLCGAAVVLTGVGPEISLMFGLVLVVNLFLRSSDGFPWLMWTALGIMTGFFPLIKVSLSVGFGALAVVAVLCAAGHRALAGLCVVWAGAISFVTAWFGTGNGFGNIFPFIRHAASIALGYSSAMSSSYLAASRGYLEWIGVMQVLAITILVWIACRKQPRNAQIAIALSSAVVSWLYAKEAFVRFDAGHVVTFFAPTSLLLAALLTPRVRWPWLVVAEAAAVTAAYVAFGSIPNLATQPIEAARHLRGEVATLASMANRSAIQMSARATMQVTYGIPQSMLSEITNRTVVVSPWEQNLLWAFPQIHPATLPVIQDYSAYTSELDELDVQYLRSPEAPDFVLKQPIGSAIDSRFGSFDPPATELAIECHYFQVASTPQWQLLKKVENRCGRPREVKTVVDGTGAPVTVPRLGPAEDVVAALSLSTPISWTIEGLVLRSPGVCVRVGVLGNPIVTTFRFVTGTAGDFHIMAAANTTGYGPLFTPPSVLTMQVTRCASDVPIATTVRFYAIHVSR